MKYLAVITEDAGYETCYVSFKDRVAQDGALVATPVVTSLSSAFVAGTPTLNSITTVVNGISHAANTLLTFTVTAAGTTAGLVGIISIAYETPVSDGTETFQVKRSSPPEALQAISQYQIGPAGTMLSEFPAPSDDQIIVADSGVWAAVSGDSKYAVERYGGGTAMTAAVNAEAILLALEADRHVEFQRGIYLCDKLDTTRLDALLGFSMRGIRQENTFQYLESVGMSFAGTVLQFTMGADADWAIDTDPTANGTGFSGPYVFENLVFSIPSLGSCIRIADESDLGFTGKHSTGVVFRGVGITFPNQIYSSPAVDNATWVEYMVAASDVASKRIDTAAKDTWGIKVTKAYEMVIEDVKVRGGRFGVDILGSDAIHVRNLRTSLQAWGIRHYLPAGSTVQGSWQGAYTEGCSACQQFYDTGTITGMRSENTTSQNGSVQVWNTNSEGLRFNWPAGGEYITISGFTGAFSGYDATDYFEPLLPIELTDETTGRTYLVGINAVTASTLQVINYATYCKANATISGININRYMGMHFILHRGESGFIDPSCEYNTAKTNLPIGVIYPAPNVTSIVSGRGYYSNTDDTNRLRIAGWTVGAAASSQAPQPAVMIIGGHRTWHPDNPLATYIGHIDDNRSIAPYFTSPETSIKGRKWVAEGAAGTRVNDSESTELEFVQIDGEWGQDLNYSTTGKTVELTDLLTAATHVFNVSIRMRAHTGSSGQAVKVYFLNRSTGVSGLDEFTVKNWTLTESWATYTFQYKTASFSNAGTAQHYLIELLNNSGLVVTPAYVGRISVELLDRINETVTAVAPALAIDIPTYIDSTSNVVAATLAAGEYLGQRKTIVMTNASNASTVSIANHVTSDPEVYNFNAVDEALVLEWMGTEWVTIYATATV